MAKKVKDSTPKKAFIKLKAFSASKGEVIKEFEKNHALAILRLPNSKWEIADERYIYSDNEIKRKPSDRGNKKPKEQ